MSLLATALDVLLITTMRRTGVQRIAQALTFARLWTACTIPCVGLIDATTTSNMSMVWLLRQHCPRLSSYSCNGITLSEPKKSTSPFYLSVFAPGRDYSFQYIQAAGDQFWVGGNPSTYCPFEDEDPDACAYDSNTVFYSNSLAVTTPGGQRIFIKEDGTLAFTVAHSASEPDAAYDGENVAYSHAGYFGPGGHHWAACRPRGSSERRRIVADLPGVDLDTEDCEGVFFYVSDLEKGKFVRMQEAQ